MTFLYFAYGSNLWPPQMRSRCATARPIGKGAVHGWRVAYDKPGADGTAKANLREAAGSEVQGVVYEVGTSDRPALDLAEPGYTPFDLDVGLDDGRVVEALTYRYEPEGTNALPADWYASLVTSGASHHDLAESYISSRLRVDVRSETGLSGLRPASSADLSAMQKILSSALSVGNGQYSVHPGHLAGWMWHDHPRFSSRVSYWMIPEEIVLVIDAGSNEINVVGAPGRDRIPVIEWAQRRLRGQGVVAGVADSDTELIQYLRATGHQPGRVSRRYRWDLEMTGVPEPELPADWEIRPADRELDAGERRRVPHAEFQSTIGADTRLQSYLRFMRSPDNDSNQGLVAVCPNGRIASFMVWWSDVSGIAQIEPFGTNPEFDGNRWGEALIHHGLRAMSDAGMDVCRVIIDEHRSHAVALCESCGFQDVDRLRWWGKP